MDPGRDRHVDLVGPSGTRYTGDLHAGLGFDPMDHVKALADMGYEVPERDAPDPFADPQWRYGLVGNAGTGKRSLDLACMLAKS